MKLLQDLEQAGYLTATNVRQLGHYASKWKVSSYEAMIATHILTEHSLADAIAQTYKLERIYSFDAQAVDHVALGQIPFYKAHSYPCFTPSRDAQGSYTVCLLNPEDQEMMDYLKKELVNFRAVILDKFLMERSIEEAYPLHMQLPSLTQIS